MYQLHSTSPGGGADHGEWPTMKMATLVARAIQAADPRRSRSFYARPDFRDVMIAVPLTPPEPAIDMEVSLPDGRVLWASDLQDELDLRHKFQGDLMYAITTNGCGELWLEDAGGEVLLRRTASATSDDDIESFVRDVSAMLRDAEFHV